MAGAATLRLLVAGLLGCGTVVATAVADSPSATLRPLFATHCVGCHSADDPEAGIDLEDVATFLPARVDPTILARVLKVIDTGAMPPDGEDPLAAAARAAAVGVLRGLLRDATAGAEQPQTHLRRLTRFQYNNVVRDLFELDRDVFPLPEKLLTRLDPYLQPAGDGSRPERMADTVRAVCRSLEPAAGLAAVEPFPKDLRAAHGFDNEAAQLTLSPLLLDAFLRLSTSIVDSPDFNERTVGIWQEFFAEPAEPLVGAAEIDRRLARFLPRAFRGPVDNETRGRYAAYAARQLEAGLSFTAAMRKTASAVLSSPLFLFVQPAAAADDRQFALATRLALFLWGSGPDDELRKLAAEGRLDRPDVLAPVVERMLANPKVERFLDIFPTQWLQLENLLAATPDPAVDGVFRLDPEVPASLQMLPEPLLLFDAVFLENRPVGELLTPSFAYRSEFLQAWYRDGLKGPAGVDPAAIIAENTRLDAERRRLGEQAARARVELDALVAEARRQVVRDRPAQRRTDLRPLAAWDFDGTLEDSVNGLDLTAHGNVTFADGMVSLEKAYLQSGPLPVALTAKTLEIRCRIADPNQSGGGAMAIQGPNDVFDAIVLGERQRAHWILGSDRFARTEDFAGSLPEQAVDELLHLVMVCAADGTTALYRNGSLYGKPYRTGVFEFPARETTVLFGLRHLPPAESKFLTMRIDEARLYDRALTEAEVATAADGFSETDLVAALSAEERIRHGQLVTELAATNAALAKVPANRKPEAERREATREFEAGVKRLLRSPLYRRVPADDPRYGGVITNAATLTMTSGAKRTRPVARGVWVIEAIFNDPPAPPPNDVPPLPEDADVANLTIRERFAAHRESPSCAGCHTKLDPLGFALENFDVTGRWRDTYENGRPVDAAGMLLRTHAFANVVEFKAALAREQTRFARAFTAHLLRYALARKLGPADIVAVDEIVTRTESDGCRLRSLIREVALSDAFVNAE